MNTGEDSTLRDYILVTIALVSMILSSDELIT